MLGACFLRFLGGDVPPGSLNADPILCSNFMLQFFFQNMPFSTPKIYLLCTEKSVVEGHFNLWDCGMLEIGFEFEFELNFELDFKLNFELHFECYENSSNKLI